MANRGPTVTLTFAGDSANLGRTIAKVNAETKTLSDRIGSTSKIAALGFGGIATASAASSLAVAGALAAVPAAFAGIGIAAAAQSEKVKTAFTGLKDHVVTTTQQLAKPFESVLTGIADRAKKTFDQIAPSLGRIFADTAPMVDKLATAVLSLVKNAMPGFEAAVKAAGPIIDALSAGITQLGPAISQFFTNLSGGSQGAAGGIKVLFDILATLLPILGSVIGFFAQFAPIIVPIAAAMTGLSLAVSLVTKATAAYNLITTTVSAVTKLWTAAQWLLNIALSANPIALVVIAIAALVAGIIYAFNNVAGFRELVLSVWEAVKSAFSAGVDFAVAKLGELVGWFTGLPGKILGAIGNVGSLLVSSGNALVSGFLNGIKAAWGNLVSWVRQGMANLRALWPFSPAKDGPFSGRGYVTFSGKALTNDFAESILAGTRTVSGAAESVLNAARGAMTGNVAVSAPRTPISTAAARSSSSIQFTGNVDSAFATAFMRLVRSGQVQIQVG